MHASLYICKNIHICKTYIYAITQTYTRVHTCTHTHTYIYMEKEYRPQPKPLAQISSGTDSNSPMVSLCYDPMV